MANNTVVTGVVGDDVHVIGIRIVEHALRAAGFDLVSLGAQVSKTEFIEAAIETGAKSILISSLNGHAEMELQGFKDACIESGLGGVVLYLGGHLSIRRPDWNQVEATFKELGFDRVYRPETKPEQVVKDLIADIGLPDND